MAARKAERPWQEPRVPCESSRRPRAFLPPLPHTAPEGARETAGLAEPPGADWEAEHALLVSTKFTCGRELGQGLTGP